MNRKQFSRVGSAMIGATLLLSALVPAATAAPPKWSMTVTQLVPGGVSAGSEQGFDIVITNTGSSNISSLYLFDTVGDNTVYVTDSRGLCNPAGGPLYCNFGALRSKESVTARVAYAFPTSKGDGNITFEINTTGVVLGGNNSHGDALLRSQTVLLLAGDSDKAGRWVTTPGYNVANNQVLGGTNPQATKVSGLGQYIPVTVEDGSSVSFSCPKSVCKTKQFGQWSKVNVNFGATFASPFLVTITIAKSAAAFERGPGQAGRVPRAGQRHRRDHRHGLRRDRTGGG